MEWLIIEILCQLVAGTQTPDKQFTTENRDISHLAKTMGMIGGHQPGRKLRENGDEWKCACSSCASSYFRQVFLQQIDGRLGHKKNKCAVL